MNFSKNQIAFHVFGWCIFFMLPIIFIDSSLFNELLNQTHFGLLPIIASNIIFMIIFYVNYFMLIPRFLLQKKPLYYFGIIAFILSVILIIKTNLLPESEIDTIPIFKGHFKEYKFFTSVQGVLMFSISIFASLYARLTKEWSNSEKRREEAEKDKLSAELSYIKSQINPHFLFNSLNSVYSLSIKQHPKTPEAVLKLSSLMAYVLEDAQEEFVSIEKEIEYISDYIELQKLRSNHLIDIQYMTTIVDKSSRIAPLILITFIENAFKYGLSAEAHSPIFVKINVTNAELILIVKNNKHNKINTIEKKSELGIANAKKRLLNTYPSQHTLSISENDSEFVVHLNITLS